MVPDIAHLNLTRDTNWIEANTRPTKKGERVKAKKEDEKKNTLQTIRNIYIAVHLNR